MKEPHLEDYGLTKEVYEQYKRFLHRKFEEDKKTEKIETILFIVLWCGAFLLAGIFGGLGLIKSTVGIALFSVFELMIFLAPAFTPSIVKKFRNTISFGDKEEACKRYEKDLRDYESYLRRRTREYYENMSGFEFEKAIAALYRQYGYGAYVTQATGDGGVDVILRRNGECVAVQCKHHANPVGPKDIRELQGVVMTSDEFDYGIFVSWNGFTPGALEEARVKAQRVRIDLVASGDILIMAGKAHEGFEVRKRPNEPDESGSESGSGENFRDKFDSINKPSPKKVCLGSIVKAYDYGEEEEVTYRILVGDSPYEESEGWIAISSETPVAQALLGHKENDIVEVTPNGEKYSLKILEIS